MSKKYHRFICALFCLFLAGFLAANLLLPDRQFSPQENRYLTQMPELSLESVTNGEFMEDFEEYHSDQFAGRDFWIGLKAWCERLTGKQENNGVYFGTDGAQTLFAQFTSPTQEDMAQRLAYVNALGENVEVPVYFSLIPGKNTVWSDLLPQGAPLADESGALEQAMGSCVSVEWLDLVTPLLDKKDEYVFYRTDHHWTSLGAYYGYLALMEGMGMTPVEFTGTPELVSDSFLGTTYSSAGAKWVEPDEMYRWIDQGDTKVTSYFTGMPEEGSLYVDSYLSEKDKYSYFLGGNQPLCVLDTGLEDAPSVLVVRDSYTDSLAPFLTQNFSQIHLFDLRYNNMSLKSYVEENGIDMVLVLYSVSNFTTDTNLFKLGL
jgi:hypothetical protein